MGCGSHGAGWALNFIGGRCSEPGGRAVDPHRIAQREQRFLFDFARGPRCCMHKKDICLPMNMGVPSRITPIKARDCAHMGGRGWTLAPGDA